MAGRRQIELPQNLLDRAIAYVAPELALRRGMARAKLALSGGYTGARFDRAALSRWNPGGGSPTSDLIPDLPTLRERSRDQYRNAPVALGAVNTAVSHIVGTGLTMTPALNAKALGLTDEQAQEWQDDTSLRFLAWAASVDSDLARRVNFYGQQDLALRTVLVSGDAFVLTPEVAGRLAVQLLEGDYVSNPDRAQDKPDLIAGLEIDTRTSQTIACHITNRHPGDITAEALTWQRVVMRGPSGRQRVLHLFKPDRPGQLRGVPWLAPILEPLKQLNRYTDAELKAAVDSAMFSVFVKMDHEAFREIFDEPAQQAIAENAGKWSGEMEAGKAVNLMPGEDITSVTPGRPNVAFDPFVQAILRQIGMALELPFEVLVMHYQSSYSAARAALLTAWKFFRGRRDWLATYFCQPIYELWLAKEIAEGRISAPGYFRDPLRRHLWSAAVWTGDGPGSIDPVKEIQAAKERIAEGISTREAESILHDGISWRVKHPQRVREEQARKRDGLATVAAMPAAPAVDLSDSPDSPEDGEDDPTPGDDQGMPATLPRRRARAAKPDPADELIVQLAAQLLKPTDDAS